MESPVMDPNKNPSSSLLGLIEGQLKASSLEMSQSAARNVLQHLEPIKSELSVFAVNGEEHGTIDQGVIGMETMNMARMGVARLLLDKLPTFVYQNIPLVLELIREPETEMEVIISNAIGQMMASALVTHFMSLSVPSRRSNLSHLAVNILAFYDNSAGDSTTNDDLGALLSSRVGLWSGHSDKSGVNQSTKDLIRSVLIDGMSLSFASLGSLIESLVPALRPCRLAWLWAVAGLYASYRLDAIQSLSAFKTALTLQEEEEPLVRYLQFISLANLNKGSLLAELLPEALSSTDDNLQLFALSAAVRLERGLPKELGDGVHQSSTAFDDLRARVRTLNSSGVCFPTASIYHVVETLFMPSEPKRDPLLGTSFLSCQWEPRTAQLDRLFERKLYLLDSIGSNSERLAIEELKGEVSCQETRGMAQLYLWLHDPVAEGKVEISEIVKTLSGGPDCLVMKEYVGLLLRLHEVRMRKDESTCSATPSD